MLIFLFLLLIAGGVIVLSPSKKLKVIFSVYFIGLYVVMFGVMGLVEAGKTQDMELTVVTTVNFIILFIHVPLIYYLYKLDHKKHRLKKAREIFGTDIGHLTDDKLHEHLKHK